MMNETSRPDKPVMIYRKTAILQKNEGKEMSNFICEYCNTEITEGSDGIYTTECKHYPLTLSNLAKRSPILALADILAGEFGDTPTAKRILALWQGTKGEQRNEQPTMRCTVA